MAHRSSREYIAADAAATVRADLVAANGSSGRSPH